MKNRFLFILFSLLLLISCSPAASAYGDRSLYLKFDKVSYSLGDTVKITAYLGTDSCKEHGHLLDFYVYDSQNLLLFQIPGERQGGISLSPEDFPFGVTCKPPKVDIYTVKLFVIHGSGWGHPQVYLEDTATFSVVPYVSTFQTTSTTATTTQSSKTTLTSLSTVSSTSIVPVPTTDRPPTQTDSNDLLTIGIMIVLIAAIATLGFIIAKRKRSTKVVAQTPVAKKYCIQCGKEVPADASFCVGCGVKQE